MPIITDARALIRTEETRETAAVSSAVFQKNSGTVNFLANRVDHEHSWKINSKFGSNLGSPTDYVDGAYFVDFDMEIVFFGAYIQDPGETYFTTINVDRFTAPGVSASIFTAAPRFEPTAADNSFMSVRYNPDETFDNPTGTVLPTFVSRNLNKGDVLLFNMTTRGKAARNMTVTLKFRPR